MESLIKKYSQKLAAHGLCDPDAPLIGGLDDHIVWTGGGPGKDILTSVINGLNINSILFSRPAEPYNSIINYLSSRVSDGGEITPEDSETRTLFHAFPVVDEFDPLVLIGHLKKRKSVIVKNEGIVAFGMVSPEQAFIVYSSVCFSCFIKFFTDLYYDTRRGAAVSGRRVKIARDALAHYRDFFYKLDMKPNMRKGPFADSDAILSAIVRAGRLTVESRMLDSFFGNISYRADRVIYISQTGSSLDELEGCIDACPIDNSRTNAITASSEFSAHKSVYSLTDYNAILHGHPKFSVIMSMLCDEPDCRYRGSCFKSCSKERFINDIPIIPGEVGTGPTGISRTLPPALKGRGAIVYGHGLFTTGKEDFTDAYYSLLDIERTCLEEYMRLVTL